MSVTNEQRGVHGKFTGGTALFRSVCETYRHKDTSEEMV